VPDQPTVERAHVELRMSNGKTHHIEFTPQPNDPVNLDYEWRADPIETTREQLTPTHRTWRPGPQIGRLTLAGHITSATTSTDQPDQRRDDDLTPAEREAVAAHCQAIDQILRARALATDPGTYWPDDHAARLVDAVHAAAGPFVLAPQITDEEAEEIKQRFREVMASGRITVLPAQPIGYRVRTGADEHRVYAPEDVEVIYQGDAPGRRRDDQMNTSTGKPRPYVACELGVAGDWCALQIGHTGPCNPTRRISAPAETVPDGGDGAGVGAAAPCSSPTCADECDAACLSGIRNRTRR
jgi:hypothetical protein